VGKEPNEQSESYVARCPICQGLTLLCVVDNSKMTAESVAAAIRRGDIIGRMTRAEVKAGNWTWCETNHAATRQPALFPGERLPAAPPGAAPATRPCSASEWTEAAEWAGQDREEGRGR
jgi:hypothetical protein